MPMSDADSDADVRDPIPTPTPRQRTRVGVTSGMGPWTGLIAVVLLHALVGCQAGRGGLAPSSGEPVSSSGTSPVTVVTDGTPAGAERVDHLLEPIRERHGVPGLGGGFVRGGELVAIGVTGVRQAGSDVRVEITDRFHLGSCTKAMTATVAAVLVEEGTITWSTTIGDVFPDLRGSGVEPSYLGVTLRQLLANRSGLPEDRDPPLLTWTAVVALSGSERARRVAAVPIVLRQKPVGDPGEFFAYSNLGYTVTGAMLEQAAGASWEDLMRERLCEPLGMERYGFGAPGSPDTIDQPRGHLPPLITFLGGRPRPVRPGPGADNPSVIGPAGTFHCSLVDWAKFISLHLRGARGAGGLLLDPATFRLLHAPEGGYALGWQVAERKWAGGRVLVHSGSNRRWYAVVWIAPKRNAAIFAATNLGSESAELACDEAVGVLIGEYLPSDD